ncbi:hypothetical protein Droror1_Dr00014127 [Drosera rotundifolia]
MNPPPPPHPPPPHFTAIDEQSLRDEVLFLHHLHRRGPPILSLTPSSLKPTTKPSPFKRKKPKTPLSSDKPWPTTTDSPSSTQSGSGWAQFKPRPNIPARRTATAHESVSIVASKSQHKALESSTEFFNDEEEEEEDDNDRDSDDDEGSVEYSFFVNVFEGDRELRSYYEGNWGKGEFVCLVCGGMGLKLRKRYGNCVSLVTHCVTVRKTGRRKAHRRFGMVVCRVLGWDIGNLPHIVPPPEKEALSDSAVPAQDSSKNAEDNKLGSEEVIANNNGNSSDNQKTDENIGGSASKEAGDMTIDEISGSGGEPAEPETS